MYIALGYFIFISLISIFVCVKDKLSAIEGNRRISEKTLLNLSVLGGALVMYVTMRLIRHKTKHVKFMVGLPIIIILQISVIMIILKKLEYF